MKQLVIPVAAVAALVTLSRSQDFTFAEGPAAQEPRPVVQLTSPARTRWEYKVVGMVERHGSTLSYLRRALDGDTNPLDLAKGVDEQVALKTEDLLNELGAEGWELEHFADWALILKRPAVE